MNKLSIKVFSNKVLISIRNKVNIRKVDKKGGSVITIEEVNLKGRKKAGKKLSAYYKKKWGLK